MRAIDLRLDFRTIDVCVPVCRGHHGELQRHGDESAWWTKVGIDLKPKTEPFGCKHTRFPSTVVWRRYDSSGFVRFAGSEMFGSRNNIVADAATSLARTFPRPSRAACSRPLGAPSSADKPSSLVGASSPWQVASERFLTEGSRRIDSKGASTPSLAKSNRTLSIPTYRMPPSAAINSVIVPTASHY